MLIIDLDAHGSGGTHSLIAGDDRIQQLDIAVNAYESYTVRRPNVYNFIRYPGSYLPVLRLRLETLLARCISTRSPRAPNPGWR